MISIEPRTTTCTNAVSFLPKNRSGHQKVSWLGFRRRPGNWFVGGGGGGGSTHLPKPVHLQARTTTRTSRVATESTLTRHLLSRSCRSASRRSHTASAAFTCALAKGSRAGPASAAEPRGELGLTPCIISEKVGIMAVVVAVVVVLVVVGVLFVVPAALVPASAEPPPDVGAGDDLLL